MWKSETLIGYASSTPQKFLFPFYIYILIVTHLFFFSLDLDSQSAIRRTNQSQSENPNRNSLLLFCLSSLAIVAILERNPLTYVSVLLRLLTYTWSHTNTSCLFCAGILGERGVMVFRCLKFSESSRKSRVAMAKSAFKLDHPLGLFFFFCFISTRDFLYGSVLVNIHVSVVVNFVLCMI